MPTPARISILVKVHPLFVINYYRYGFLHKNSTLENWGQDMGTIGLEIHLPLALHMLANNSSIHVVLLAVLLTISGRINVFKPLYPLGERQGIHQKSGAHLEQDRETIGEKCGPRKITCNGCTQPTP